MFKYRIVVTWSNELTQTFHIRRKEPLKFEDFNLRELLKEKETDNIIGLYIVEMDKLPNA